MSTPYIKNTCTEDGFVEVDTRDLLDQPYTPSGSDNESNEQDETDTGIPEAAGVEEQIKDEGGDPQHLQGAHSSLPAETATNEGEEGAIATAWNSTVQATQTIFSSVYNMMTPVFGPDHPEKVDASPSTESDLEIGAACFKGSKSNAKDDEQELSNQSGSSGDGRGAQTAVQHKGELSSSSEDDDDRKLHSGGEATQGELSSSMGMLREGDLPQTAYSRISRERAYMAALRHYFQLMRFQRMRIWEESKEIEEFRQAQGANTGDDDNELVSLGAGEDHSIPERARISDEKETVPIEGQDNVSAKEEIGDAPSTKQESGNACSEELDSRPVEEKAESLSEVLESENLSETENKEC